MAAFRSSLKIIEKLNLQPVSNIELFPIHAELELGVLGIARKLVKDVIYLWWYNFGKIIFSSYKLPKQQTTTFEFQGIVRD